MDNVLEKSEDFMAMLDNLEEETQKRNLEKYIETIHDKANDLETM